MSSMGRKPSIAWQFMNRIDACTVKCTICEASLVYNKSTTSMIRHLYNLHPEHLGANASSDSEEFQTYKKYVERHKGKIRYQSDEKTCHNGKASSDDGLATARNLSNLSWQFMERIDACTVKCTICEASLVYNKSTTSMIRHLYDLHPEHFGANASSDSEEFQTYKKYVERHKGKIRYQSDDKTCDNGKASSDDDLATGRNLSNLSSGKKGDQAQGTQFGPKPFKASIVWKVMDFVDPNTVMCNLCGALYRFQKSTTSLLRHVQKNHPEYAVEEPIALKPKASSRVEKNCQLNKRLSTSMRTRSKTISNGDTLSSQSNFWGENDENISDLNDQYEEDNDSSSNSDFPHEDSTPTRRSKKSQEFFTDDRDQFKAPEEKRRKYNNRPRTSVVWKFMNKDSASATSCKICKHKFQTTSSSTTGMLTHMRRVHSEVMEHVEDEEWMAIYLSKINTPLSPRILTPTMDCDLPNPTVTNESGDAGTSPASSIQQSSAIVHGSSTPKKSLPNPARPRCIGHKFEPYVNLILDELLPCSFVESAGFKNFAKAVVDPRLTVPDQKALEEGIMEIYEKHRKQIHLKINEAPGISLSAEIWDYRSSRQYMTVTGHFVSKSWELKSVILKTVLLDTDISDVMEKILEDWNIKDKVTCIVTSASEILTTAISQLNKPHIQCVATVLNSIVTDSLKSSTYFEHLAGKVRCITGLIQRTPEAAEHLAEAQTEAGRTPLPVLQDSGSEWMSTYKMLSRYKSLHSEILKIVVDQTTEGYYSLEAQEVESLHLCVGLLEPFALTGEELASESYPSMAKAVAVLEILQQMLSSQVKLCSEGEPVSSLAKDLQERLDNFMKSHIKSGANLLHYTAALLDPRFKPSVLKNADTCSRVQRDLERQVAGDNEEVESDQTERELPSIECVSENYSSALWSSFDHTVKLSVLEKPVNEVHRYVDEGPVSRQENPLLYWKDREPLYPKLCSVVKKYLSIPATSVAANQVFSEEEKTKFSQRNFLEESNLDSILFLNSCRSMCSSYIV